MTSEISERSKKRRHRHEKGQRDSVSPAPWPSLHIEDQFLLHIPFFVGHHGGNSLQFPGVAQSVAANSVQCCWSLD